MCVDPGDGFARVTAGSEGGGVGTRGAWEGVVRAVCPSELLASAWVALCWDVCSGGACRREEEASVAWWWTGGSGEQSPEEGEVVCVLL